MSHAKLRPEFEFLRTVPGIGTIPALTIMSEAGDIGRFDKVGNYSSYCRCVKSERISNEKLKGRGNAKNGNKYLSRAYVEAANFAVRHSPEARKFRQRKMAKTNGSIHNFWKKITDPDEAEQGQKECENFFFALPRAERAVTGGEKRGGFS